MRESERIVELTKGDICYCLLICLLIGYMIGCVLGVSPILFYAVLAALSLHILWIRYHWSSAPENDEEQREAKP